MKEHKWLKDIKWVFFDLDNTLIDFKETSRRALQLLLSDVDQDYFEDIYLDFKEINASVWHAFENNEISGEKVRSLRFDLLFERHPISNESGLTFGKRYLEAIVEHSFVYDGVSKMLDTLKANNGLSIITNGFIEVQRPRLHKLDLAHYFDTIVVSDEIKLSKPDLAYFDYAHSLVSPTIDPEQILVVGDSLNSDIKGGKQFGARTCWLSHGSSMNGDVEPDIAMYDITDFQQMVVDHIK